MFERNRAARWLWLLLIITMASATAGAQEAGKKPVDNTAGQQTIDEFDLAVLIKSPIVALQHANATGNYSVLRDLGTPIFRERYDQAALASIFAPLREKGVNLSPVLLQMPYLTAQPTLSPQGQLLLVGHFDTKPVRIEFELSFLDLDGAWRLDGINVRATAVDPSATDKGGGPAAANSGEKPAQSEAVPSKKNPAAKKTGE